MLLAASMPGTEASAARVRLWRGLKDLGAANLRDGVSVAPAGDATHGRLEEIRAAVEEAGGSAWLLELPSQKASMEKRLRALLKEDDVQDCTTPDPLLLRHCLADMTLIRCLVALLLAAAGAALLLLPAHGAFAAKLVVRGGRCVALRFHPCKLSATSGGPPRACRQ